MKTGNKRQWGRWTGWLGGCGEGDKGHLVSAEHIVIHLGNLYLDQSCPWGAQEKSGREYYRDEVEENCFTCVILFLIGWACCYESTSPWTVPPGMLIHGPRVFKEQKYCLRAARSSRWQKRWGRLGQVRAPSREDWEHLVAWLMPFGAHRPEGVTCISP